MRWILLVAALVGAFACGESHGRVDAGPGSDAQLFDRQVIDGPIWAGTRDGAIVLPDGGIPDACEVLFPSTAFVQDRLANAHDNTIARGALQLLRTTGIGPQPQPAPVPNPGPPMEAPDGRFTDQATPVQPGSGNCGNEAVSGYAWDGHRCRGVRLAYCRSADCAALAATVGQCAAEHATCAPEVCRRTGGQWSEVPISCSASAWSNGVSYGNGDCRGPTSAQCICPVNQSFGETGCAPSSAPLSAEYTGCYASGGKIDDSCGAFTCGTPAPTGCVGYACNCGPNRNFNTATLRCEIDARCHPAPNALCLASGGTWSDNFCGPHTCGVQNPQRCASGGCNCGALGVYDDELGCVLAPSCRTNACF